MGEFTILDSGKREVYVSGMERDIQNNKPRFDLLLPLNSKYEDTLLYRWAMLLERGMLKYGERNWEKANSFEELNRFKSSAFRHFIQLMNGENAEDHFAAVCFNLNAVLYLMNKLKINIRGDSVGK